MRSRSFLHQLEAVKLIYDLQETLRWVSSCLDQPPAPQVRYISHDLKSVDSEFRHCNFFIKDLKALHPKALISSCTKDEGCLVQVHNSFSLLWDSLSVIGSHRKKNEEVEVFGWREIGAGKGFFSAYERKKLSPMGFCISLLLVVSCQSEVSNWHPRLPDESSSKFFVTYIVGNTGGLRFTTTESLLCPGRCELRNTVRLWRWRGQVHKIFLLDPIDSTRSTVIASAMEEVQNPRLVSNHTFSRQLPEVFWIFE